MLFEGIPDKIDEHGQEMVEVATRDALNKSNGSQLIILESSIDGYPVNFNWISYLSIRLLDTD